MYQIVFLLLSSFLFFSCTDKKTKSIALPYYNEPDFTPLFMDNKSEVDEKITHQINDFSFLNQDSIFISQKEIENKIHVANFIFTSCGSICPTMTKNMKTVSDSLKNDKDLVFLSFSVTPWIDKPFILKKYKTTNNITNQNWHFLTGTKGSIYQLARQSYFAEEDIGYSKDSTEFLHTEHFVLVDKTKRIRGIYNGTLTLEMQQLIEDIKTLNEEK
ncbi:SCO family protein [Runella aurantiaca]|uniref:SCO family protein n=1 Tax=Runella aurantiaca TaxID=2282308 RepID=A0A369IBV6_9BACT|nr:SCO family protein [Runella aurantiaca]RDB06522.1 SCO family protein [Runella aurantiaca]